MAKTDILKTLVNIGNDVASIWGGHCKSVSINTEDKKVTFLCSEYGEEFVTDMTFGEIEAEYGVKVA